MRDKVELLAPAGCEENFYGAVNHGANAVYLGLPSFSARKNASNFTFEKLQFIVAYAHIFGVKVFVAVNTVIKNSELENYFSHIKQAYECGVDAFIVQDIFLGRRLKALIPGITLHLSTQAGINNLDGAKQAVSYGFSRVILARETPFDEIKKIAAIVETEVFIHGALCTCLSGHCYLSSFIGGMSGNRGLCRQPCRKVYKYQGKGIKDDMRYALSLSDLCLASKIQELILAGVKSFKIEGRMRSFEYVCAACDFYNDLLCGNELQRQKYENLKRSYNRGGYTEGLTFGQQKNFISDKIQNHAGSVVATISEIRGNELILSRVKHNIREGDCFKILTNGYETGHAMAVVKNNKIAVIFKEKAYVGSELSITKDISLIEKYSEKKKLHKVTVCVTATVGEKLKLNLNGIDYYSDFEVVPALTSSVTKSEIKQNLRKSDIYPFEVIPSCTLSGDVFIPKKVMNELRARAYKEYFLSFANNNIICDKNQDFNFDFENNYTNENCAITVISNDFAFNNFNGLKNLVFCPENYNDKSQFANFFNQTKKFTADKYLYIPAFLTEKDEKIISAVIEPFDGIYCESASGLFLAKRYKKKFFGGIELNVANNFTYEALQLDGASEIALSKELSKSEIDKMPGGSVLALGNIKVMSLIYCPFGKTCADCNRHSYFILKDGAGREFPVRRYRISECRFEIYNEKMLRSKTDFSKQIFDFTGVSANKVNEIIKLHLENKNSPDYTFTSGNLQKGVE